MAFILADRATITTRVEIGIPLDLGKIEKAYLDVTWKRQSVSEKKAHTEKLRAGDIKDDEIITQLITNIEGAKDENGTELTFSPELLAQLLEIDYVRQPFTEELLNQLYGKGFMEQLKAKNS